VRQLTAELGARMLVLSGLAPDVASGRTAILAVLDSGAALERFRRFVELQGGDPRAVDDPARLPRAAVVREVKAPEAGWVAAIDTRVIGFAANELGAGRTRVEDAVDPAVGFVFRVGLGDRVERGEVVVEIHARTGDDADRAAERVLGAIRLGDAPTCPAALVLSAPDG
jgi:thymidine phosphorylase